jgi:dTDP-4-dehydrorhamnose 3,5-epimerase
VLFTEIKIAGAYVVELDRKEDDRGFFARGWCRREFAERGLNPRVLQMNVGYSHRKGTLRGLHFQLAPHTEVKMVRCTRGAIYDVLVDLRPESPSFKRWLAVELTPENGRMLYVPEGCAQGYQTLVDGTEMYYFTTSFFAPEAARGVRYDDPVFGIEWPLEIAAISEADRRWPDFQPLP